MKRIAILQNDPTDSAGLLGTLLQEQSIPFIILDVETTNAYPAPENCAAVIALGGAQHLYYNEERYPYLAKEKTFLSEIVQHEIPFLGICLGAQLLASVLGGQVRRHMLTEIGFCNVPLTPAGIQDPLYRGLPGYHTVFQWHQDTFILPQGAVLLATNEATKNQGFRYGRNAYGVQYHIELDEPMVDLWLHSPASQHDIVSAIGMDGYQKIVREHTQYYSEFCAHTRILLKNFLAISQVF